MKLLKLFLSSAALLKLLFLLVGLRLSKSAESSDSSSDSSDTVSNIFKSSSYHHEYGSSVTSDIPSSFQIQSSEAASNGQSVCIEANDVANGATLSIQLCSSGESNQMFSVDDYGRISLTDNPTFCITKKKKDLQISSCGNPGNLNMFVYNAMETTLNWKKNGFNVISVSPASPLVGAQVTLTKRGRNVNKAMQNWELVSVDGTVFLVNIPGTFLTQNMRATSSGDDLCMEPTSLSSGATIKAKACDANNSAQQWDVDNVGRVYPVDDENLCIHRITKKPKIVLASCSGSTNLNMLMYNAFENTLLMKRNGYKNFSLAGDEATAGKKVRLSNRKDDLDKKTQQWTFEGDEAINIINYVGNPCGSNGECTICQGDCDDDSDCSGGLRCAQRSKEIGVENVPGCIWGSDPDGRRFEDDDYCFQPQTTQDKVINYVGECDSSGYLCKECEGDCDSDSDCEGDLICEQRSGHEAVTGCTGEGSSIDIYAKDVCVSSGQPPQGPVPNALTIRADECSSGNPCDECEGSCSGDSECKSDLTCFVRSGLEPIPNCVTGGSGDVSDTNYCHERPTEGDVTYIPGDLTVNENGLLLSTGLTARIVATTGTFVGYADGSSSDKRFHEDPDGAAVFAISSGSNAGGWYYVSNSEEDYSSNSIIPKGGVGRLTFNSNGDVIDYEMIVENTSDNCGGGKTYWNTWVTCEEFSSGQVHEVNPFIGVSSQQQTVLGNSGGKYESFAYDARDLTSPTFYVTHDSSSGGMVRFTPDSATVAAANASGDYSNVLTTMGDGKIEWLVLNPSGNTFSWRSNRSVADSNAFNNYPNSEGIDIRNGLLYFVVKGEKRLFILDLDNFTYEVSSTRSGAFDGQPDQVARIIASDPDSDMLYFCEEASADNGVHARDSEGNFYTILTGDSVYSETTGLAFSPDNKHMYLSYQSDGIIYDVTRTDGYPFGAHRLDIKYHAS